MNRQRLLGYLKVSLTTKANKSIGYCTWRLPTDSYERAGERDRTVDIQLGKLTFYH